MLRTKVLAGLLAFTVAAPGLAAADPSTLDEWNGAYRSGHSHDSELRRAYELGRREAIGQARRDGWRDDRGRNERADRKRREAELRRRASRDDWRRDRYDDDDWRRDRDELSPADIIIPLLLR